MHGKYSDDVLIAIRKIIRAIDIHSRRLLQKYGLTGPQLVILSEITREEKSTISQIASRASLSQGTVTSIIDRLEKRGFVVRARSDNDRRKVMVYATEQGLRVIASRPSLIQERFVARFDILEDWEKTQILSSLNRVVAMMQVPEDMSDSAPLLASGSLSVSPESAKAYLGEETEEDIREGQEP